MATKWTKEQLEAIETRDCNLLVAAAAGSGKTAVLVERIIKIITDAKRPVDIDKLLVVTFTNAAAAEMRERIGAAIAKELDSQPESKLLQRQLTLLNRSNITTMHSFCLDVIRNNFHQIDLDPGFRIAIDTEAVLMKQEVLEELFEDSFQQGNEGFIRLVEAFGGGRDDGRLKELVYNIYSFAMSGPYPEKWLREKAEDFNLPEDYDLSSSPWGRILLESAAVELRGLKSRLILALDICEEDEGLEPYAENFKDDIRIIEYLIEALDKGFKEGSLAFSGFKFSTLKRLKKGAEYDEDSQAKVKAIREEVKKKVKDIGGSVFGVSMEESVKNIIAMYPFMQELSELVLEFNERYKSVKKDRGVLDFNDLEHYCLEILLDKESEEPKPSAVALELRESFEEVLVDEYQDSNNVQETIINMVSRKFTDKPNVFMVGDVKQSIYRFRQAKPELFLDKYARYSEEEGASERKILLYKNFRSREEVIRGVNYIFKELMSETVGELNYTSKEALNLGADYKENNEDNVEVGGDVELHILNRTSAEAEEEEQEQGQEEQEASETLAEVEEGSLEELDNIQLEARLVAKRIKELLNPDKHSEFMVYDKDLQAYRRVRYKDIVILLRATTQWAPVFSEELGLQGIPVYADSGTGYFDTVEIRTIMSLLNIIDNPMQDIPMLAVLRSPIFSFTPEELADLRTREKNRYFYENIKEIAQSEEDIASKELKDKCLYFMEYLTKWRDKCLYMPIDEFIWYLYMDTSYYGYVGAMPKGSQRQANLRILFQRAREYSKTSYKGLFNFINFITKLRKSSGDMGSAKILGENEDVVRIMSIHKSKGLEFPVVILAGAGKNFNLMDLRGSILYHEVLGYGPDFVDLEKRISYSTIAKEAIKRKFKLESLSEEMRVLYVAFTRAKEKLIITGSVSDMEKSAEKWCQAASSAGRIPESEVLKGKSYLDWIAMAMAKHPEGEPIRGVNGSYVDITSDYEDSKWLVKLWNKEDILVDEAAAPVDKNEEAEALLSSEGEYSEEISRRLSFNYKYQQSSKLPANISVSELKRQALREEYDGEFVSIFKVEGLRKPEFLQEKRGLSPAERGTVVHFVMRHMDLDRVGSYGEIKEQVDKMVEMELLNEEESKAVSIKRILGFFQSSLGQRLLKVHQAGQQVYREVPFFIEVPATTVNPELPEDIYKDEMVRVQGIIDCFFEEQGELVLLDYKTDYVEEGKEDEIKERYKVQLDYYCESLLRLTGKKVREKYLYLFFNGAILKL